jgi:hypothetical protein
MASYRQSTIDMVLAALTPSAWVTASELQGALPFFLACSTIRAILQILAQSGYAIVTGDMFQRRYRAAT